MNQRQAGGVVAEGKWLNDWIHTDRMRRLAEMLGLDTLPMRQPNYDFFKNAVHRLQLRGFRGPDQYDRASDLLRDIFYDMSTEDGLGPIKDYVRRYQSQVREGNQPQPFDDYFQMMFRQKANTALKRLHREDQTRSFDYEHEDESGESLPFEGLMEDPRAMTAEDIYSEEEERARAEKLVKEFPEKLAQHRLGDKYVLIWGLMGQGYNPREIAEELNANGVLTPGGREWKTTAAYDAKHEIIEMLETLMQRWGIDRRFIFDIIREAD